MILDRIQIMLPWPDSQLMPNRKNGRHWGATVEAKVAARTAGLYAAQAALQGNNVNLGERIPARITFVAPNKRKGDTEALKRDVRGKRVLVPVRLGGRCSHKEKKNQ